MSIELSEDTWSRAFLNLSSKMAELPCQTWKWLRYRMVAPLDPTQFDHCQTVTQEIALRTTVAVGATAFFVPLVGINLVCGTLSKVFKAIGFALQNNKNHTHVRGTGPEIEVQGAIKILTWNLCGIAGGMHYDHGGVIDWRDRLDGIVAQITAADPDVLILQEVYDGALAEALIERLGPRYAHFFTHLGANTMGVVGGVMMATRCPIHNFTNTSFDNNNWDLTRTFAELEIKAKPTDSAPCARIIGTHLIHNNNDGRMAQMAQIVNTVAQRRFQVPTVLAGDLNLERDDPNQGGRLNAQWIHSYRGPTPTRTGELLKQWDPTATDVATETIDYISLLRQEGQQATLDDAELVEAFDNTFNTRTALSDHHGLKTTLRLIS